MGRGRLEAFSDGVIAIAITLLILDVRLPEVAGHDGAARAVLDLWPAYVGYAISFVVIGLVWVAHHSLIAVVERVDQVLLYLNLVLLAGIAFLPFPTTLLTKALSDRDFARVGPVVYSVNMLLVSATFALILWWLARHPELLHAGDGAHAVVSTRARRAVLAPLAFTLAAPLAWLSPWVSAAVYILTGASYALARPRTVGRRLHSRRPPADVT